MSGKAYVVGGIITIVLAFVPGEAKIWDLLAVILGITLGLYIYFAVLHVRKQNKK